MFLQTVQTSHLTLPQPHIRPYSTRIQSILDWKKSSEILIFLYFQVAIEFYKILIFSSEKQKKTIEFSIEKKENSIEFSLEFSIEFSIEFAWLDKSSKIQQNEGCFLI